MVTRGLGVLALLVLVAGCQGGSTTDPFGFATEVAIIPTRSTYSAGEVVALHFNNYGSRPVEMGACFSVLYQQDPAGRWVVDRQFVNPCPHVLLKVDGYGSRDLGALLPTDLSAGRYRLYKEFSVIADGYAAPVGTLSLPFRVR